MSDDTKIYTVRFTEAEITEASDLISMSYMPGEEGNELAQRVSDKLSKALLRGKAGKGRDARNS